MSEKKPLSEKETELLILALNLLEDQFDDDEGAVASVVDSDSEEYVDIQVDYEDGTGESMAVERSRLSDGSSAKEVAEAIN